MKDMTSKERWLAALEKKPVDRLPFWPKIFDSYQFMETEALHDYVGSDRHQYLPAGTKEVHSRCSLTVRTGEGTRIREMVTPKRTLVYEEHYDQGSASWHPVRFPINDLDDLHAMTDYIKDTRIEVDREGMETARTLHGALGDRGITAAVIGESPLMFFAEWLAGVANAHYFLFDHQEEVEELFGALHANLLRSAEIQCAEHPADIFYMIENTSTTIISPDQFRTYCAGHLNSYGTLVGNAGRRLVFHMCGTLKNLLPDLALLPGLGFEAFTSPPLGNCRLVDGRAAMPDACLIGGTNAILWTQPAKTIIAEIANDLEALPHHRGIVVTSGGVMTPLCPPDVIREVAEFVRAFPQRS